VKGLYAFIWNDFCDWYVEAAKARLYGDDERRGARCRRRCVGARADGCAGPPGDAFVTEEIWGFLPGERAMLLVSPMPEPQLDHRDPALEESARNDMEVVSEARRLAGEGERPLVTAAPGSLFIRCWSARRAWPSSTTPAPRRRSWWPAATASRWRRS
jgi:valyl-tRNA synthetase